MSNEGPMPSPRPLDPTLIDLFLSQAGETAQVSVDPEWGTHMVAIEGTIDLNAMVALAMDHAAHVVRTHHVIRKQGGPIVRPTPSEFAMEFIRRAKEARA